MEFNNYRNCKTEKNIRRRIQIFFTLKGVCLSEYGEWQICCILGQESWDFGTLTRSVHAWGCFWGKRLMILTTCKTLSTTTIISSKQPPTNKQTTPQRGNNKQTNKTTTKTITKQKRFMIEHRKIIIFCIIIFLRF